MRDTIDVGSSNDGVFIAFPTKRYDKAKTPLSGKIKHILHSLTPDDVEWLIDALKKEIGQ